MASNFDEDFEENDLDCRKKLSADVLAELTEGMILQRLEMNGKFKAKKFKLDLINYRLISISSSIASKDKYYSLFEINTIKKGCSVDDLKQNGFKKLVTNEKKAAEMNDKGFLIIYDKSSQLLFLMAPTEADRDRWYRVLDYYLYLCKKRKCVLPDTKEVVKSYFKMADSSKDGKLCFNEIEQFLRVINLKLTKQKLKNIIEDIDKNNDGEFDEDEFLEFMSRISRRPGIMSLFKQIVNRKKSESVKGFPQYMTLNAFQTFLYEYQGEEKSEEECRKLILKYEPQDCKHEDKFTLAGFSLYLNDSLQQIVDPFIHENVYQDMNQPLQNYYIHSSHNTYLSGDQLQSKSKVGCYISALMKGCRLLELDCHDGPNGPQIFHKYTLTSELEFEDVIKAVKEYAFTTSEYPVILGLEIHCSPPQRKQMAECITKHLDEFLYKVEINKIEEFPTLNTLKRKIFIRSKKLSEKRLNEDKDSAQLDALLNVFQHITFSGFEKALSENKPYQGISLAESDANDLIERFAEQTIKLSKKIMIKVFPSGARVDSSNLDPISFWNYGFHMIALNLQTADLSRSLNDALFNDNGQCGYILKPDFLRDLSLKFNPNDPSTMTNKILFKIKMISAQNLPAESTSVGVVRDITDPYVIINIYGVPNDRYEKMTNYIADNGFNPVWNQDFEFIIHCPELAFVKFTVKDKDVISADDFIGDFTCRFSNIRLGYRHIKLRNKAHRGTLFVGISMKKIS